MNKKRKLLVVSPIPLHSKISHAGGKSANFYYSQFCKDDNFEVTLLCLQDETTYDFKLMVEEYSGTEVYCDQRKKKYFRKIYDFLSINYLYEYMSYILPFYFCSNGYYKRRLKYLLKLLSLEGYIPDLIFTEFAISIFLVDEIKKKFPNAKLIASCHDVIFQSKTRLLGNNKNIFNSIYLNYLKKLEKKYLNFFDLITVPSEKDKFLLEIELEIKGEKIQVITLFYTTYSLVKNLKKSSFIFYGYLRRKENYASLLWFLENVWVNFNKEYPDIDFVIIGGELDNDIKKKILLYKKIILTGFLADPSLCMSSSFAILVPLLFGAGIKVKSLEALSSGIPLISNSIGIEGIAAHDGIHFLKAENPSEWIIKMKLLVIDEGLRLSLIKNAKSLISDKYSFYKSSNNLKEVFLKI